MPAALLIDLPRHARGAGLALDRYYSIFPETDAELREVETFLTTPRNVPVAPDLLDWRPSAIRSKSLMLIRYDPSREGWPWLSVCRWPVAMAFGTDSITVNMARGCYTFEAFADPAELEAHQVALLASLRRTHPISVRLIAGEQLPLEGHA